MKILHLVCVGGSLCVAACASTLPHLLPGSAHSATAQGDSFAPAFSPDGRFVAFVSSAKNLATNENPSPFLDVYLRDLETGRTELVSVNSSGIGGGNGKSVQPTVSSNGLYVAFVSDASNLVPSDTNWFSDVFVRDMTLGITTLVSFSLNGPQDTFAFSGPAQISADGRSILFGTDATNVFLNDLNGRRGDVVVFDRLAGTNTLVTVNSSGTGSAMANGLNIGFLNSPSISENGRFVAFLSDATNLVNGVSIPSGGVYVRDLERAITYCASLTLSNFISGGPVIANNGRVFYSALDNAGAIQLFAFDIQNDASTSLASNVLNSSMLKCSADGRYIAVATSNSIAVIDADTGSSEVVCGNGVMPELKWWRSPVISANGERVAFVASTNVDAPPGLYVYDRGTGTSHPASVATNGALAGITYLSEPAISGNGHRVAFESRASDLVPGDANNATDIFVRDLNDNETLTVSAPSTTAASPFARSFVAPRGISDLARVIGFTSLDPAVAPQEDRPWCSAFVRDRVAITNRALSLPASRALGSNRLAFNITVSASGRHVAWMEQPASPNQSTLPATNIYWLDLETGANQVVACAPTTYRAGHCYYLSSDGRWLLFAATMPGNAYSQVYRRDMFTPSAGNELLSTTSGGTAPGTGDSFYPTLTPDGMWAVFFSRAMNVVTNGNTVYPLPMIVARNIATGQTKWCNRSQSGNFILYATNLVVIRNSRFVVFEAELQGYLYRYDIKSNSSALFLGSKISNFAASDDGNLVAYRKTEANNDIYVRDIRANEETLITTNALGCCPPGASGFSSAPVITGDGRYVVFASAAANLVVDDTNNATDIFVHDRTTRTTMLISRNASGAPASGSSSTPALSPDGRSVVFSSSAGDLVPGDYNNTRDVFVLRLGGEDSDFDGMDDDWELAWFNSLSRNGDGDFDGDGASDRHEFQAGTDPANGGSIFRVMTIAPASGNARTVLWQAQAGRRYRVEYKDKTNDEFWEELGIASATGNTASLVDPAPAQNRFYRVVLLP